MRWNCEVDRVIVSGVAETEIQQIKDDSKEGIAKYLLRNPNTCFLAEDNGKIAGVIMSGHVM